MLFLGSKGERDESNLHPQDLAAHQPMLNRIYSSSASIEGLGNDVADRVDPQGDRDQHSLGAEIAVRKIPR